MHLLAAGEHVEGSLVLSHCDPALERGYHPWYVVAFAIVTALEADGIAPIGHFGFAYGWTSADWAPTLRWKMYGLAEIPEDGRRMTIASHDALRAVIQNDADTYGCTCPDMLVRMIPTPEPDVYAIQQKHEPGCPMPARFRGPAGRHVTSN